MYLIVVFHIFYSGLPLEIALMYGISSIEVQCSMWKIVDSVNIIPSLNIYFPTYHFKEKEIANEFEKN